MSCNRKTHFHFVTDGIESAIAKAKELAGEKNVALHGASSVQQALKAGLLDEFHLNIAPVLLGEGVRLFDHLGAEPIPLERIRTLETPGATYPLNFSGREGYRSEKESIASFQVTPRQEAAN